MIAVFISVLSQYPFQWYYTQLLMPFALLLFIPRQTFAVFAHENLDAHFGL